MFHFYLIFTRHPQMKILSRLNIWKDFTDWFPTLLVVVQDRNNAGKKISLLFLFAKNEWFHLFFSVTVWLNYRLPTYQSQNCSTDIWQFSRQLGSSADSIRLRFSLRFKLVGFACCARASNVFTLYSCICAEAVEIVTECLQKHVPKY